jgi:RNA polymerase sigma-70 factor (ECF subfamily)
LNRDLASLTATEIQAALRQLSPEHREALTLHFLEDFSIAEIASIVGSPSGTVKSRIHHAKAEMKSILLRGEYGIK